MVYIMTLVKQTKDLTIWFVKNKSWIKLKCLEHVMASTMNLPKKFQLNEKFNAKIMLDIE